MTRSPMQRVGVIGGGQLAWMMAPGANHLGLELVIQTPQTQDPAVAIAADTILAPITDGSATQHLAKQCDVITFENEFIDLDTLRPLETQGVCFRPSLTAIAPLLDKHSQRQLVQQQGLPQPPFTSLSAAMSPQQVQAAAQAIGFPLVLKTQRLGYDGRGTVILKDLAALQQRWADLGQPPALLEKFIPFEKELAVMVARSPAGDVAMYPVVETQQVEQVCRRVIAPAAVSPAVQTQVQAIARTLVTALDYVGILGIEFFLSTDETVLINEIAPRPHNSGHYTLDACATSQFEQQLRAVTGGPLGETTLRCDRAVMVNLLGFETAHSQYEPQRHQLSKIPAANLYWYGKTAARPGRKLGHVTVCLAATASVEAMIQRLESLWYPAV